MRMRLVLVGAGEYLPVMDPVDRALLHRLGEPGRVVCLPTAAGESRLPPAAGGRRRS